MQVRAASWAHRGLWRWDTCPGKPGGQPILPHADKAARSPLHAGGPSDSRPSAVRLRGVGAGAEGSPWEGTS